MDGLAAELGGAEISGGVHFVAFDEVLEEREDVELRKGRHVLRSDEAEDLLARAGLVVLAKVVASEKSTGGRKAEVLARWFQDYH